MTVYEELGKTAEQLVAEGREFARKCMFRNEPFMHYVFVVGDEYEFAAITHYVDAYLGGADSKRVYERYKATAGITINWTAYETTYSVIGVHCKNINHYNIGALHSFLMTTVHEQQHMLSRIERDTGADHRVEDEPRTYATAFTLDHILLILRRNWNINLISVPRGVLPLTRSLGELYYHTGGAIRSDAMFSGALRQHMESTSGVVRHRSDGWRSTTYLSGGKDV